MTQIQSRGWTVFNGSLHQQRILLRGSPASDKSFWSNLHIANGMPIMVCEWLYLFLGFEKYERKKSTLIAKKGMGKENDVVLTKYRLGIDENYSLMSQPKLPAMVPDYTDFLPVRSLS